MLSLSHVLVQRLEEVIECFFVLHQILRFLQRLFNLGTLFFVHAELAFKLQNFVFRIVPYHFNWTPAPAGVFVQRVAAQLKFFELSKPLDRQLDSNSRYQLAFGGLAKNAQVRKAFLNESRLCRCPSLRFWLGADFAVSVFRGFKRLYSFFLVHDLLGLVHCSEHFQAAFGSGGVYDALCKRRPQGNGSQRKSLFSARPSCSCLMKVLSICIQNYDVFVPRLSAVLIHRRSRRSTLR